MNNKNTTPIAIAFLVIIAVVIVIFAFKGSKNTSVEQPTNVPVTTTAPHTYKNHGITLNLPGYTPTEQKSEGGPAYIITLPGGTLTYVTDATWWEKNTIPAYTYVNAQGIGSNVYKVYTYSGHTVYWFKQGNVGYEYSGDTNSIRSLTFVGWAQ